MDAHFPIMVASLHGLELKFAKLHDKFIALKFFSCYQCEHMLVPTALVIYFVLQ